MPHDRYQVVGKREYMFPSRYANLVMSKSSWTWSEESTICPLTHTWARRCLWLASVALTDKEDTELCSSHPNSTSKLALLAFFGLQTRVLLTVEWNILCVYVRLVMLVDLKAYFFMYRLFAKFLWNVWVYFYGFFSFLILYTQLYFYDLF